MNWTAALLLAGFLQVSASGFSQSKITLSLKNASLEKVFSSIELQTEYTFWYDNAVLKNSGPVTIEVKDVGIEEALEDACENQALTFNIVGKMIVVRQKIIGLKNNQSDKIGIQGRVLDEKGEPLAGASVTVKNSNSGTSTNEKGFFELKNILETAVLVISYSGYKTREEPVHGQNFISLVLAVSNSVLDQVQVIPYGTVSKRLNTGNVSTVSEKVLGQQPVSNPLNALEGRVPGLYIQQTTGVPGGAVNVQIRGINSIVNGTNPLYIVDGVPFGSQSVGSSQINQYITNGGSPFSYLNTADIESIEVLKDADATAIYGSRGSNGVILITTKKGKAGKSLIDINMYSGWGQTDRKMHLLNTQDYLQMRREAFINDGVVPDISNAPDLLNWDTTKYTDWQNKLVGGTSEITQTQVSISGGNANTQFLLSGTYHRETTVFPGDFADQKGSVYLNITHRSDNSKFRSLVTVNYLNDDNKLYGSDLSFVALVIPPNAPDFKDKQGNLIWPQGFPANPYSYLFQKYVQQTNNLISNIILSYQITPALQIRSNFGYTRTQVNEVQTNPLRSFNPAYGYTAANTYTNFGDNNFNTWIVEPQLNWHSVFAKSELDILAGITFQQDLRQGQTLTATGFNNEGLMENIAAANTINAMSSVYTQYRYNAMFGRINYDWDSKYIINLTVRRDGSSRFGPGKQFANFGAIGAAWIFSSEGFVKNHLSFISFGKLRMSYGSTGNDQIGDYQYLSIWTPTPYPYQGNSSIAPVQLANPDYAWEVNKKMEAAIELGLFKDKVFFQASFYRNRSSNQLIGYSLPPSVGFSYIQGNLPALVQNLGTELELSVTNVHTHDFTWITSLNISFAVNKLLSFPGLASSSYANRFVVGKSVSTLKAFHEHEVDPQTGVYLFSTGIKDSFTSQPVYPDDLRSVKQMSQEYFGGFTNSFRYKGLELDIFFQFVKQTGFNYMKAFNPPGTLSNQPMAVLDRWQKPSDNKPIQEFTQGGGNGKAYLAYVYAQIFPADNIIGDASFIRLKNVSLSWQLPGQWKQKIHLQKARIYIQGQNLLTITHYSGLDPETTALSTLPPLRIISTGIQLTF